MSSSSEIRAINDDTTSSYRCFASFFSVCLKCTEKHEKKKEDEIPHHTWDSQFKEHVFALAETADSNSKWFERRPQIPQGTKNAAQAADRRALVAARSLCAPRCFYQQYFPRKPNPNRSLHESSPRVRVMFLWLQLLL